MKKIFSKGIGKCEGRPWYEKWRIRKTQKRSWEAEIGEETGARWRQRDSDWIRLSWHHTSHSGPERKVQQNFIFFHFTFLQIDRLNFDVRPDGDDTEDMDDVDDVEATKGKHEMKVSNMIIVTQTSFENPPYKKSERIASRFLYW